MPIPLGVIAELLGVPDQDIPRLYEWTEQIERSQRSEAPADATQTFAAMAAYLQQEIVRQLREANEDSLVMLVKRAEVDGQSLTDSEILRFFALLTFAGNDTTRNTAATGMLALLEHPQELARLRVDPSLIGQAVEEILRFTSVVQWFVRTATRDTRLAGQTIREGEKVLMWYPSGSCDEAVYADPQRFDVTRSDHTHNAFGGGGRHFCLGAGLARLELRPIFEEVLRRMPDLHLAGDVQRLPSSWAHALTAMPVRFTPGQPEG